MRYNFYYIIVETLNCFPRILPRNLCKNELEFALINNILRIFIEIVLHFLKLHDLDLMKPQSERCRQKRNEYVKNGTALETWN